MSAAAADIPKDYAVNDASIEVEEFDDALERGSAFWHEVYQAGRLDGYHSGFDQAASASKSTMPIAIILFSIVGFACGLAAGLFLPGLVS